MLPSAPLRSFIRAFEYQPLLPSTPSAPVWPHGHTLLSILFGDPLQVRDRRHDAIRRFSGAVLSGPITHHYIDLLIGERRTAQLMIVFQPGGALRLFGIPARVLTDEAFDAEELLGADVRTLTERLQNARTLPDMVAVAESYLLARAAGAGGPTAVESAAHAQMRNHGLLPIAELIDASGFGRSRFERCFVEHVGMTPKLFARVVRFDNALRLHTTDPALSWIAISHDAGYFDQNHLVKEFKAMTGQSPSAPHGSRLRITGGDDWVAGAAPASLKADAFCGADRQVSAVF